MNLSFEYTKDQKLYCIFCANIVTTFNLSLRETTIYNYNCFNCAQTKRKPKVNYKVQVHPEHSKENIYIGTLVGVSVIWNDNLSLSFLGQDHISVDNFILTKTYTASKTLISLKNLMKLPLSLIPTDGIDPLLDKVEKLLPFI